ncbi:MAG: hypothetical protein JST80_12525 [Bdellovibrionales bacterium]|nr:hypothetical protein [Bdellovibrionales bacterium]
MKLKSPFGLLISTLILTACATSLPKERHLSYFFPDHEVYVDKPTGKRFGQTFKPLGWVKTKVRWPTMEQAPNDQSLCRNYYNKGAAQLFDEGEKVGADAVIQVRSVVLLLNGQMQEYPTPECSDDGAEGEILMKGIAIRYDPTPTPAPSRKH